MTMSAVPQELLQQRLDRQQSRLAIDQRQEDDGERILQRRELIELIQHDIRIGVAFQVDDQPHRFLQITFVADSGDSLDATIVDQGRNPFDDPIAELLVGNLGDDDPRSTPVALFDRRPSTNGDRAAAGVVAATNAAAPADHAAGGEIGARHDLQQLVDRHVRLVDQL